MPTIEYRQDQYKRVESRLINELKFPRINSKKDADQDIRLEKDCEPYLK